MPSVISFSSDMRESAARVAFAVVVSVESSDGAIDGEELYVEKRREFCFDDARIGRLDSKDRAITTDTGRGFSEKEVESLSSRCQMTQHPTTTETRVVMMSMRRAER